MEEGTRPVNLNVEFRTGSAELTPAAIRTLNELGRALSNAQLSSYRFRIEGHTDTVGSPEMNKQLSERRAEAVAAFLASKFGIDRSRLETAGLGEEGLLVPTPPETPEPRNRRVQIINVGA
jgi:outer membrane protein OmpA-like peptidoglycan-associated protein